MVEGFPEDCFIPLFGNLGWFCIVPEFCKDFHQVVKCYSGPCPHFLLGSMEISWKFLKCVKEFSRLWYTPKTHNKVIKFREYLFQTYLLHSTMFELKHAIVNTNLSLINCCDIIGVDVTNTDSFHNKFFGIFCNSHSPFQCKNPQTLFFICL